MPVDDPLAGVIWARLFDAGYDRWYGTLQAANSRVTLYTGPEDQAVKPVIPLPSPAFKVELADALSDFTPQSVLKAWAENHKKVVMAAVKGGIFPWSIRCPELQLHLVNAAAKVQNPRAAPALGEACKKWNMGSCAEVCTLNPQRAHKCSKCGAAHRAKDCQQGNP